MVLERDLPETLWVEVCNLWMIASQYYKLLLLQILPFVPVNCTGLGLNDKLMGYRAGGVGLEVETLRGT